MRLDDNLIKHFGVSKFLIVTSSGEASETPVQIQGRGSFACKEASKPVRSSATSKPNSEVQETEFELPIQEHGSHWLKGTKGEKQMSKFGGNWSGHKNALFEHFLWWHVG